MSEKICEINNLLIENTDKLLNSNNESMNDKQNDTKSNKSYEGKYIDSLNDIINDNNYEGLKTSRNDFRQRVNKLKEHFDKRNNY